MSGEQVSEAKPGAIYAAMIKIMAECGVVGKMRKNPQQGYQFRGIDDVVAHLNQVMASHGVFPVPYVVTAERELMPTKAGGSMVSVRLLVDHIFTAVDGSRVTTRTLGEAMDSGDKASNKAQSTALKYSLTEVFMIPTYEADRDTEEASPVIDPAEALKAKLAAEQKAKPTPVERVRAALSSSGEPMPLPSYGNAKGQPSGAPTTLPNYGRAQGQPIAGQDAKTLTFYANGCRRSLADPDKARFHAKEKALLEAIEAELFGGSGEVPPDASEPPPHGDADAPF